MIETYQLSQIDEIIGGNVVGTGGNLTRLMALHAGIQLYYGASGVSYATYLRLEELIDHPLRVGKPFPEVSLSFDEDDIYIETPYTIEGISAPYHVGDEGYLDPEGYLILKGRSDSLINVAGVKVSLLKIENEIRKIVGVEDAVVCSNFKLPPS